MQPTFLEAQSPIFNLYQLPRYYLRSRPNQQDIPPTQRAFALIKAMHLQTHRSNSKESRESHVNTQPWCLKKQYVNDSGGGMPFADPRW
jgi:hypothetical protein